MDEVLLGVAGPAWWLCPNQPRCDHAGVVHDIEDFEDQTPRCCADGCQCGAKVEAARG